MRGSVVIDENYIKRERGASSGFLLIGLVLVALVAGGIYYVQNRDQSDEVATNTGTTSKTSDENKKPDKSDSSTKKPNTGSSKSASTDSDLPETGPADSVVAIIASGILAASIASYIQSARGSREYSKS